MKDVVSLQSKTYVHLIVLTMKNLQKNFHVSYVKCIIWSRAAVHSSSVNRFAFPETWIRLQHLCWLAHIQLWRTSHNSLVLKAYRITAYVHNNTHKLIKFWKCSSVIFIVFKFVFNNILFPLAVLGSPSLFYSQTKDNKIYHNIDYKLPVIFNTLI